MNIPPQQTFDTVVKHLRTQRCRAVNDSGNCQYRTAENLRCAAGCLIPDELYDPAMESTEPIHPQHLAGQVIIKLGHVFTLVLALQRIHDTYKVAAWENELQRIANRFSLTWVAHTELAP
jgi:hypothetical protein